MTLSQLIGKILDEKITEKGMNYSKFAEEAGVSQGYVSKIVSGSVKGIQLDTLEKLVSPLGMTITQILEEVEKKKRPSMSLSPVLI